MGKMMSAFSKNEKGVAAHYTHGDLLNTINQSLSKQGQTLANTTPEQLTAMDEFHIGGRAATIHLLNQAELLSSLLNGNPKTSINQQISKPHWLDIGCGLGGTARYIASQYGLSVTGIDLTAEYLNVAQVITEILLSNNASKNGGLIGEINFVEASALALPFADESFSGISMLHVGMNISDKNKLFTEVYRCLRPGSSFLIYDVLKIEECDIQYPLPWASVAHNSHLSTLVEYQQALTTAGFEIVKVNNRREFALDFFDEQAEKIKLQGIKPVLSLHTLIQDNGKEKFKNLIQQIKANAIAPIEIIVKKSP